MNWQIQIDALEKEIKEKKETLAKLRSRITPEGVEDYTLKDFDNKDVKLSELFGDKEELILVWNMGKSCPYCTLWADGYNGLTDHLNNRAAFVVVSPDAPEVQKEFANSRGWKFRMVSRKGSTFGRDFNMETEKGLQLPGVSVFLKDDRGLYLQTTTQFGPGDNFCPMWDFIDLLPSDTNWAPKFSY